jgi:hypothetical protein
MNENRSSDPTPEQLLQLLEMELSTKRAKRQRTSANRTAWRIGGILLMLGGAIAALLILQYAMTELTSREGKEGARTERAQF